MELDTFVAKTLEQIVRGVMQAQKAVSGTTAGINAFPEAPAAQRASKDTLTHTFPQDVEFDIAVTVQSGTGSEGKLSVSMWGIAAGVGGNSSAGHESVSRIRFKVPVVFPLHENDQRKKA